MTEYTLSNRTPSTNNNIDIPVLVSNLYIPDGRILIFGSNVIGGLDLAEDITHYLKQSQSKAQVQRVMNIEEIDAAFKYSSGEEYKREINPNYPSRVIVMDEMRATDPNNYSRWTVSTRREPNSFANRIRTMCEDQQIPCWDFEGRYIRQFYQEPISQPSRFNPRQLIKSLINKFRR